MADELKRVGLVFKADGSVDFQKSLKEINASVQENRSAFKLAQSQWDKNTKSADKLKDRQKYLAEQTKDYADKVKILEKQLEDLENAENRDEKAIQSKMNQLNTAKTSLNNYKKGLEEVNEQLKHGGTELEDYAKKVDAVGEKLTKAGKSLSTKVTAPIAAVGGLAIKSAMELDEGYDTIITKTGATGDALQNLNDVADEVFGSMPVDMAVVGVAIGEVNTRFGSTGDELEDLSRKFIEFSEINGVDLNNSIGTVDKIMTQFRVDTSYTGDILGIFTARSQETGIATDTLMGLVSSNSATFKELGFSVEESINMLAMFEQNGVDTSTAMTGLKKSISNMAKEGIPASEALETVIESIKNATTETEAINKASEIFGTKGAVEMVSAIRDGRFSLDELSDSMLNYGDLVNQTYEETLDPWDKMKVATNDLKLAGEDLAGSIFETLAPMMEMLSQKIEQVSNWYQSLDDDQKNLIVKIGLVIAAIGPLLLVFGAAASGISGIIGFAKLLIALFTTGIPNACTFVSNSMEGLWGIMAAHPIGAIITAIGILIGAFIYAYNNCEEFRDGVNRIWRGIVDFFKDCVDKIKKIFDFEWKLPEIKLPHFSIEGGFSLKPLRVPHFFVDWYAKGGILNKPTVFGLNGNSLMAGGEAGKEAVLPIHLLKDYIREENMANNSVLVGAIKEALAELNLVAENNIYIGDRKVVEILTDMVLKKMAVKSSQINALKGR